MTYIEKKEKLRKEAKDYKLAQKDYIWSQILYYDDYFYRKGKKYGLLKELRSEKIII